MTTLIYKIDLETLKDLNPVLTVLKGAACGATCAPDNFLIQIGDKIYEETQKYTNKPKSIRKTPIPNIVFNLRKTAIEFIDNSKNIPDFLKPLAKEYVTTHINIISVYLSTIELAWRRTDHFKMNEEKNEL